MYICMYIYKRCMEWDAFSVSVSVSVSVLSSFYQDFVM